MAKEIQLTQGQVALVDDDDFEELNRYKWFALKVYNMKRLEFYACRRVPIDGKQSLLRMHNAIMGPIPKGMTVDHKDRNRLNNQKSNLRFATSNQQSSNASKRAMKTSKYKGVSRFKDGRWIAFVMAKGKQNYLGLFVNEEDAARARDKVAVELHGEFAVLNFPGETYDGNESV